MFIFLFTLILADQLFAQELTGSQKDSIKNVLTQMIETDQKYRGQLTFGELSLAKIDSIDKLPLDIRNSIIIKTQNGQSGFNQNVRDSLSILQEKIDSLNKIKFINIIDKYGYPSYRRIGSNGSNVLSIHYTSPKDFQDLLPVFQEQLAKDNMPVREYASWYDRCQLFMGKKQLYGEYDSKYPCVENLKITNNERKKIGLKKLEENNCR
jgi:hypothetical protein